MDFIEKDVKCLSVSFMKKKELQNMAYFIKISDEGMPKEPLQKGR